MVVALPRDDGYFLDPTFSRKTIMFKTFAIGVLVGAVCLICVDSSHAFGRRRQATNNYTYTVPTTTSNTMTAPVPVQTAPVTPSAPAVAAPVPQVAAPVYQPQYYTPAQPSTGSWPYTSYPRSQMQAPFWSYPKTDPRRYNFNQY
jgi:hypothetical protein